jgi:hypothetical protein
MSNTTLFWVCYTAAGNAKPTADQVRNGQTWTGAQLPPTEFGSESVTLSGSGTFTWAVGATGLTAGTDYKFAAVTLTGNDAAVVESATWTTDTGGVVFPVTLGDTLTFTDSQNTAANLFAVARAETVTLTDSQNTAANLFAVARAETVTLTDSQTGTVPVIACDPYWANVALLVQGGANGSTVIQDLSDNAATVTINAGASFSSAQQVFGNNTIAAVQILPNIAPFQSTGANSLFARPPGQAVTIECYIRRNVLANFSPSGILWNWADPTGGIIGSVRFEGNSGALIWFSSGGPSSILYTVPIDTTVFSQFTVVNNTFTLDINGAQVHTGLMSSPIDAGTYKFFIGATAVVDTAPSFWWTGPLRFTQGIARSRGSVPTAEFPTIPCGNTFAVAHAETVTLTDSQTGVVPVVGVNTVTETVSLSASQSAFITSATNSVSEQITLTDSQVARATFAVGRAEVITLTDSRDGSLPGLQTATASESFTLSDFQIGAMDAGLCPGLPPGWVMTRVLESVPNPNFGTTYGNNYFVRWTYITTDENGQFVCASGADTDCCAQAHAMAEQRTQQKPYNQAI